MLLKLLSFWKRWHAFFASLFCCILYLYCCFYNTFFLAISLSALFFCIQFFHWWWQLYSCWNACVLFKHFWLEYIPQYSDIVRLYSYLCCIFLLVKCDASTKLHTPDDMASCDSAGIYRWIFEEGKPTCDIWTQILGHCCNGRWPFSREIVCYIWAFSWGGNAKMMMLLSTALWKIGFPCPC